MGFLKYPLLERGFLGNAKACPVAEHIVRVYGKLLSSSSSYFGLDLGYAWAVSLSGLYLFFQVGLHLKGT